MTTQQVSKTYTHGLFFGPYRSTSEFRFQGGVTLDRSDAGWGLSFCIGRHGFVFGRDFRR